MADYRNDLTLLRVLDSDPCLTLGEAQWLARAIQSGRDDDADYPDDDTQTTDDRDGLAVSVGGEVF